jgi:hypothetical protein
MSYSPSSFPQPWPQSTPYHIAALAPSTTYPNDRFSEDDYSQLASPWSHAATTDQRQYSPYHDPELMQLLSMKAIVIYGPQDSSMEIHNSRDTVPDTGRPDHPQTAPSSTTNEQHRSQILGYSPSSRLHAPTPAPRHSVRNGTHDHYAPARSSSVGVTPKARRKARRKAQTHASGFTFSSPTTPSAYPTDRNRDQPLIASHVDSPPSCCAHSSGSSTIYDQAGGPIRVADRMLPRTVNGRNPVMLDMLDHQSRHYDGRGVGTWQRTPAVKDVFGITTLLAVENPLLPSR